MKKNAILIGLGLLIVLLFVGNAARTPYFRLVFVDRLSENLNDYYLQLTMPRTVDERIVILDIDEKSLKEEGRWPWGRDRMALLLDKLFDKYGIAVVGFDIVFAERDDSSGLRVLQQLAQNQLRDVKQFQTVLTQIQPQLEYDNLFASKIRGRKVVLGYYLTDQKDKRVSGMLPEPSFQAGSFKGRPIGFTTWNGYGANLPEFQQAAASAGHFNPKVDFDGMVRRVPMLAEYDGAYYEPLSLAVVRTLLGQTELIPGFVEGKSGGYAGLEWLELRTVNGSLKI
ncbi:MAG: CHASE2 domain-containing protein, partial [Gallionella sp.]